MLKYRYERKFLIENCSLKEIYLLVKFHPAGFTEIYNQRKINNLYFDTHDLRYFKDAVEGNKDRIKYRIRWYDNFDLFRFEKKIKKGYLGTKGVFDVDFLNLEDKISFKIRNKVKNEILKQHFPTLMNSYHRKYFISADGNFRITVDSLLEYNYVRGHKILKTEKYTDYKRIILEIKYSPEQDKNVASITQHLPFRLSKSSKYVNGISILRM